MLLLLRRWYSFLILSWRCLFKTKKLSEAVIVVRQYELFECIFDPCYISPDSPFNLGVGHRYWIVQNL